MPSWLLAILAVLKDLLVSIGVKVLETPARKVEVDVQEGPLAKPPRRKSGLYGLRSRGERK